LPCAAKSVRRTVGCSSKFHNIAGRPEEGRKQFFFEKKNQKTFMSWRTLPEKTATAT
jgi:hypothetical protein